MPLRKRILFSLIAIVVFFIILDKTIALYDKVIQPRFFPNPTKQKREFFLTPEQEDDYYQCHKLDIYPYVMFKVRPGFKSDTININSFGFRGNEFDIAKPQDVYRIVIIGGSGAWGAVASSDDKTFSSILEKMLNESSSNIKFEVINAGVPSYNSSQELILLETQIIRLKPNMVIIYDGFNDIHFSMVKDRRPGFPYLYSEYETIINTPAIKRVLERFLNKIRFVRKIRNFTRGKEGKNYSPNYEALDVYKNNMDTMCHLLKSYDIKPVLVLQPIIHFKKPLTDSEKAVISLNNPQLNQSYVLMYGKAAEDAAEVARNNNVPFINSVSAFDGMDKTVFNDNMHINDRGQEIIAALLYGEIEKILPAEKTGR